MLPNEDTVHVTVLVDHTTDGEPHRAGEQYDAPAGAVDFLVWQGLAVPVAPEAPLPKDG